MLRAGFCTRWSSSAVLYAHHGILFSVSTAVHFSINSSRSRLLSGIWPALVGSTMPPENVKRAPFPSAHLAGTPATATPVLFLKNSGLGFNAPLCLVMLTYFIMHLASSLIRQCSRRQGGSPGGEKQVLLQTLTFSQWAWKVFPVAAASGLEVRLLWGYYIKFRTYIPPNLSIPGRCVRILEHRLGSFLQHY